MLVTRENAEKIVQGCQLAATVRSNGYSGKLCDVRAYSGTHGAGYTVTSGGNTEYYVYPGAQVRESVYKGGYSVKDAVKVARDVTAVDYHGVQVTPTWELQLDTLTGDSAFHKTSDYKPITFAGRTLTVCWVGAIDEKNLRYKIRRKLREMVNAGKAGVV